ncbi:transposase family protein [Streptomyces sp. NPDC005531]|uniref:transposase family protein n=1 Tax=Streptomyces sp. NPDC005531 TaxID=3364722 RepID=UPI0036C6E4BF
MPDPRPDQGRRHPLAFVLSLAACAVLAGAKSLAAIAEWAVDAPPNVLARLGGPCRWSPSTPSTRRPPTRASSSRTSTPTTSR